MIATGETVDLAEWIIDDTHDLSCLGCQAIVLKDVGVPSYALRGKKAVLSCDYDLENQELYAVKWYKNGEEFYR